MSWYVWLLIWYDSGSGELIKNRYKEYKVGVGCFMFWDGYVLVLVV